MGFKLKPKEEKFFELLIENTILIRKAADELDGAMYDQENLSKIVDDIDDLESQADQITNKIFELLNKTFITPMDREDIYAIANKLDDIIDAIQGTAERMLIYNTGKPSETICQLSSLVVRAAKQIEKIFDQLPQIKKNRDKIEERCDRIVAMEIEGDKLYRQEMAKLFREATDPVEIIKWKEILTILEETLDACEDISDLIRGALLKYA